MCFVPIVRSVLLNDSFFLLKLFCFNNRNTSVRSFMFFPINDSFLYIERESFLIFRQWINHLNIQQASMDSILPLV